MVLKVSKGGVRSGNTLRGLRSKTTRRYSRQACIVGRSNLTPKGIMTFMDSFIEDNLVSSTLGSTDVILSLNKKERWLLPSVVSHMIKTGNFNEGKTMVSLLERHKLKRKANCVSFVCNQGRFRHVALKQKRYFSFNLENIDNDLSNRQKKREKAELIKRSKLAEVTSKMKPAVQTIEAFTVSGSSRRYIDSSKPEYRLEVFYPCPQSCSLVYNLKYTSAPLLFNEEGIAETKSSAKFSKGKRRHRKQFTTKDLKMYQAEMNARDSTDFWDDDFNEFECDSVCHGESNDNYYGSENYFKTDTINLEDTDAQNGNYENLSHIPENILASLIAQAENAKTLCDNYKTRRSRKNSSKYQGDRVSYSTGEDKSHIVYTSEKKYELRARKKRLTKAQKQAAREAPKQPTTDYVTLQSVQVILTSEDTRPSNLKARFGHLYAEAESEPRRFVINVTEDVQNLLSTSRSTDQIAVFTSFLVFVYDGVYDEGLDTFKVIFNSNTCTETSMISKSIAYQKTSVEEIVNRVACSLLDMKQENLLCTHNTDSSSKPILKFVNDLMRVDVEIFRTSDEIRRVLHTNDIQENASLSVSLDNIVIDLEFDIFCDICYENINSTQLGAISGTQLSRCSHNFCDECWRSHIRTKLKNGATKVSCPGYECEETVGPVTLLSLLHVSEVAQLFQRVCEERNETSQNCRWCPNPGCGRIIKLGIGRETGDVSLDVTCACGYEFCFSCQTQPHWPATCDQAGEYHVKLQGLKSLNASSANSASNLHHSISSSQSCGVFEIEGRVCPKCSKFIDKDGGCKHIICKCGYQFCWLCMKEWNGYNPHKCTPNSSFVSVFSRKTKIRHLVTPVLYNVDGEASKKLEPDGSRQKTTMYRKAVQERLEAKNFKKHKQIKEMVKKIASISQRDHLLKKEILTICGVNTDDTDETSLASLPFTPHVTTFLRTSNEIKRALHHVAEYTFVLLQDVPDSVDKRRAFRLATDLSGYCMFIKSVLELERHQDLRTALKRLGDIQKWAKRALNVLLSTVEILK